MLTELLLFRSAIERSPQYFKCSHTERTVGIRNDEHGGQAAARQQYIDNWALHHEVLAPTLARSDHH